MTTANLASGNLTVRLNYCPLHRTLLGFPQSSDHSPDQGDWRENVKAVTSRAGGVKLGEDRAGVGLHLAICPLYGSVPLAVFFSKTELSIKL